MELNENKSLRLSVHVLCGSERGGWINPTLAEGLVQLAMQRGDIQLGIQPVKNLRPVAFARNHALECSIKSGADWALLVDNDQVIGPNFIELIRKADCTPVVDIVCAPTWQWSAHANFPVVNNWADDGMTERIVLPDSPGFQEIYAGGSGVILIRTKILETILRPWFCAPLDPTTQQELLGEDLFFCRSARAAGFKIHTHPGFPCGHLRTADLRNFAETLAGRRDGWSAN